MFSDEAMSSTSFGWVRELSVSGSTLWQVACPYLSELCPCRGSGDSRHGHGLGQRGLRGHEGRGRRAVRQEPGGFRASGRLQRRSWSSHDRANSVELTTAEIAATGPSCFARRCDGALAGWVDCPTRVVAPRLNNVCNRVAYAVSGRDRTASRQPLERHATERGPTN